MPAYNRSEPAHNLNCFLSSCTSCRKGCNSVPFRQWGLLFSSTTKTRWISNKITPQLKQFETFRMWRSRKLKAVECLTYLHQKWLKRMWEVFSLSGGVSIFFLVSTMGTTVQRENGRYVNHFSQNAIVYTNISSFVSFVVLQTHLWIFFCTPLNVTLYQSPNFISEHIAYLLSIFFSRCCGNVLAFQFAMLKKAIMLKLLCISISYNLTFTSIVQMSACNVKGLVSNQWCKVLK